MKIIAISEKTSRLAALLVFNELQMLEDRIKNYSYDLGLAEKDEIGLEIYDLKVFLKQLQGK
jgi:hypothetical protein